MFLQHYLHNTMLEMFFYFTKLLHCCTQKVCFDILMTTMLLICRCGRFPPEVRTAIPVEGRFEHVVLSCSTTSDHAIAWIERESQKALEVYSHYTYCRFILTNFHVFSLFSELEYLVDYTVIQLLNLGHIIFMVDIPLYLQKIVRK